MSKRITQRMILELLKKELFRPDSPPTYLRRCGTLAPGMSVTEYKPNMKGKQPSYFSVRAYQGAHVPIHWESVEMVSLKEAVAWANARAEEAARIWESEE